MFEHLFDLAMVTKFLKFLFFLSPDASIDFVAFVNISLASIEFDLNCPIHLMY